MKDTNATVIVDIKPDEKEILKNFQKEARWGIRKAVKEGLRVIETNSEEDWKEFYEIYKVVASVGGTTVHSLEKLKANTKTFFVCKKDEKIIGGAGIWFVDKYDANIPRLYFIASLSEYLDAQPNNLLDWACMLWSKRKGYEKFDLGGWQIGATDHLAGINKFKERFGQVVYYEKEYPFFKALGRKLIRKSKFAKYVWDKYKGREV